MFYLFGAAAGLLQPSMFSVNARLRRRVGSPFWTTMISYSVSLVFLIVLMTATGQFGSGMFGKLVGEPGWVWINGVIGVTALTINTLVVAKLGGIEAVILPLIGQILGGLTIDSLGLLRTDVIPLSVTRVLGAVLVVAGVLYASTKNDKIQGRVTAEANSMKRLVWYFLSIFAGVCNAIMTAIYRYTGTLLGTPFRASFVTTVVGCITLGIVCLIPFLNKPYLKDRDTSSTPWWIFTGGIFGSLFACANVIASQKVGVGMAIILVLVGSTIGGLIIDQFGLFGVAKHPVTARKIIGVVIMIVGTGLIRLL